MQFITKKSDYKSLKADLLVVGMFKDGKQNKSLDIVFNQNLSKAVKIEQFNGSYKKNITFKVNKDISSNISRALSTAL